MSHLQTLIDMPKRIRHSWATVNCNCQLNISFLTVYVAYSHQLNEWLYLESGLLSVAYLTVANLARVIASAHC